MTAKVIEFEPARQDRSEIERLRTVLFWIIGDVEAQHHSCGCGASPTELEKRNLASAKAALGSWRPKGFDDV